MNTTEHRTGLITLYESQVIGAGPFMTAVLNEAIRKLKETEIKPKSIEQWVVDLEKQFSKFLK